MAAARIAVTALVGVTVVDVLHTTVALALYQYRIGIVTHDGSGIGDLLGTVLPLRELSPVLAQLLLLTLVTAGGATAAWLVRIRDSGLPVPSMAAWWWSVGIAVPLNLTAAGWYLSATGRGAGHMRAVQSGTVLLMTAACLALVTAAFVGVTVIRRTTAAVTDAEGAGLAAAGR